MPDDTSWITPEEKISGRVFIGTLALVFVALRWPDLPAGWLNSILWSGLGAMILLAPPTTRLPGMWPLLALGFVLCSSLGFLPRDWFAIPSWRTDLEALGLDTGPHAFVQARLAAETLLGQTITAIAVIYLLGHRVGQRFHLSLAVAFAIGVAILAGWSMAIHDKGETFGFFPNRNHSACILAVGGIMGFGAFIQAVRQKAPVQIGLAVVATAIILIALLAYSESRAGIVLLGLGLAIVLPLMGRRYISGHAGIAMLLVVGTVTAAFFIVDSKAKRRLVATVEKLEYRGEAGHDALPDDSPIAATPQALDAPPLDGRVSIFQDTLTMIRTEPWTGVGPWQFQYVFPQYRVQSGEPNNSIAYHPESNWLWLAAESGLAATTCVFLGLTLAIGSGLRGAWQGRCRALRMAGIVAALLVPIHGFVDISGHRPGIAWAAALLLALAFRPESGSRQSPQTEPSGTSTAIWRVLGTAVIASGIFLLQANLRGEPVLSADRTRQIMSEFKTLYDKDNAAFELARKENRTYDPPPQEDPLEMAITTVNRAIAVLPLENHFHYVRGNLALHYDDKQAIVNQAFAIQRRLAPGCIDIALRQAIASSTSDLPLTKTLWEEALTRAKRLENTVPNAHHNSETTFRRILQSATQNAKLAALAFEFTADNPTWRDLWGQQFPPAILDSVMPAALDSTTNPEDKAKLLQIWRKRGTKAALDAFGGTQQ